ncbi:MAG: hypothetical protein S4CHLAM102_01580 [Chlamydiia bacterium]|nr:hypothetical protein [Chlamydiia bacterium]
MLQPDSETGWIHAYSHPTQNSHKIPLYENFCYIYYLFSLRQKESFETGAILLEKLLAYQVDGRFPRYMHEFPTPSPLGVNQWLLYPLSWIRLKTENLLSLSIRKKLDQAFTLLIDQFAPSYHLDALKNNTPPPNQLPSFHTGKDDIDLFILSLSLLTNNCKEDYLLQALSQLKGHYHSHLSMPLIPPTQAIEIDGKLIPSLIHLLFAPDKYLDDPRLALYAPMIKPLIEIAEILPEITPPHLTSLRDKHYEWLVQSGQSSLLRVVKEFTYSDTPWHRGFCLLYFAFGQSSLVCNRFCGALSTQTIENGIETQFTFDGPIANDKEREELVFMIRKEHGCTPLINGERATLFDLDQPLQLTTPTHSVQLEFESEKGRFLGSISLGNRPNNSPSDTLDDWVIAIRTLEREDEARLTLKLTYTEQVVSASLL